MRPPSLPFFALAAALALGACSTMRWAKPGADEATLTGDLTACRLQAERKYGAGGSFAPAAPIDPRFGTAMGPSPAELRMQLGQAVGQCMRGKGYSLVPAE